MKIRKLVTIVEEVLNEMDQEVNPPTRKAASIAVVSNPLSGKFYEDLTPLFEIGNEVGLLLGKRSISALGIEKHNVHSYGKGAIVGLKGEIEHAAAVLHPKLGAAFRKEVDGGKAIIPSTKKVGSAGTSIDIPLFYRNAAFVISHIDSMEIRIPDAPLENEILVAVVITDAGRPLSRIGGLSLNDVVGKDGLR